MIQQDVFYEHDVKLKSCDWVTVATAPPLGIVCTTPHQPSSQSGYLDQSVSKQRISDFFVYTPHDAQQQQQQQQQHE